MPLPLPLTGGGFAWPSLLDALSLATSQGVLMFYWARGSLFLVSQFSITSMHHTIDLKTCLLDVFELWVFSPPFDSSNSKNSTTQYLTNRFLRL